MAWNLDFISEEDFKKHVRATIMKYGEKLESYDLKRFNSNLIDPVKLIFDKSVYRTSWDEIVNNEIKVNHSHLLKERLNSFDDHDKYIQSLTNYKEQFKIIKKKVKILYRISNIINIV